MGEFNVNKSDGSLEQTAGMPSEYPATQVMLESGDSVEDAIDELAANKQNSVSVYGTQTYSGTTSTSTTVLSLQLPAGKYMVLPAGYVNGYGAYIYKGTTGTGWSVNGTSTITLTETTTLNIGPASSSSTTWTNFGLRFLKIA